ncbi:hypothetical protein [Nocardioides sp. 503]|nr:hypothetical protein [Nocardioides sp. 503]
MTPRPAVPEGRFGCPLCPQRFVVLGDKKRHIRETHPKENR